MIRIDSDARPWKSSCAQLGERDDGVLDQGLLAPKFIAVAWTASRT